MQEKRKIRMLIKGLTLAVSTLLLLGGCVAQSSGTYLNSNPIAGQTVPKADLPEPKPGDKYYYSNGAREEVLSVENGVIELERRRERFRTDFQNIVLRYARTQTPVFIFERDVQDRDSWFSSKPNPDTLWPLHAGKTADFSIKVTRTPLDATASRTFWRDWDCEVKSPENTVSLVGAFVTYPIVCSQYSRRGGFLNKYTWYYSPELETYIVRRKLHRKRGVSARVLTAVRPSLDSVTRSERREIILTWQNALEKTPSGEARIWSNRNRSVAVSVTPLRTFQKSDGEFCRTYRQILLRDGEERLYGGMACRKGKLKWRTPRRVPIN